MKFILNRHFIYCLVFTKFSSEHPYMQNIPKVDAVDISTNLSNLFCADIRHPIKKSVRQRRGLCLQFASILMITRHKK